MLDGPSSPSPVLVLVAFISFLFFFLHFLSFPFLFSSTPCKLATEEVETMVQESITKEDMEMVTRGFVLMYFIDPNSGP